jgi:endonuclease-8
VGRPVTAAASIALGEKIGALVGSTPEAVTSRGKNLLFSFSNDLVLYTHMKMTGSWHIYQHGEPWRKNPRAARVRIENAAFVAVCFSAPVVELMTRARALRHPALADLGPDLLDARPDFAEMKRRLRARAETPLGEALLDQRALAGLGNVYKSELCFLLGLDPFAPVGALSDAELDRLLGLGRRLMQENLGTFRRTTRHEADRQRYWVYGRSGAGCHHCGATIGRRLQGPSARSTYYCPVCQRGARRPPGSRPRGRRAGP